MRGASAVLVGGPSSIFTWVADLVRAAAAASEPAIHVRQLDRNDAFQGGELSEHRQQVIISQSPSPSLIEAVANQTLPVLAVLEDPLDSVAYLRRTSGCSLGEAIRAQTAAAVVNVALRGNASVQYLYRGYPASSGEVIGDILGHLRRSEERRVGKGG